MWRNRRLVLRYVENTEKDPMVCVSFKAPLKRMLIFDAMVISIKGWQTEGGFRSQSLSQINTVIVEVGVE